jgi:hypothetical protein
VNALLTLASLIAALTWLSGILWYPVLDLLIVNALAWLIAVVAAFCVGFLRVTDARLALAVGNAAILTGLLSLFSLSAFSAASDNPLATAIFFVTGFLVSTGYAMLAGWGLRWLVGAVERRR